MGVGTGGHRGIKLNFQKKVHIHRVFPIPVTHDGAANMSGTRNGVQAPFIKQESHHTLYVNCLAHSLNLCLKEVIRGYDNMSSTRNGI